MDKMAKLMDFLTDDKALKIIYVGGCDCTAA
jgi:hypothetical protein